MINYEQLQEDYYVINNSKKVLYWNGAEWMKPIKDRQGRLGSYITRLDKQPTKIKTITSVWETECANLYKNI